jgi:hypothetical protein
MANYIKSGTTIYSATTRNTTFSVGVSSASDYGPTSEKGFYAGITPPVSGYTIYVHKNTGGPSIHVANNDSECVFFLKSFGATGSTISEVLNWSTGRTDMWVQSTELTITDITGSTPSYTEGLYKTTFSGYFNDNVNFFTTATSQSFGSNPATSVQTTTISEPNTDDGSTFSCQWLGYFKPTTSETYTFFTSSDDASYVWVGSNAISGFTTGNSTVNNGGLHGPLEKSGTISLTAGQYYPIRIQFGENSGGDVMVFNFSTPTITKTTNVTGLVFYNSSTNGF